MWEEEQKTSFRVAVTILETLGFIVFLGALMTMVIL